MAVINGTASKDFIHRAGDGLTVPAGFNEIATVTTGDDTIKAFGGNDKVFADAGKDLVDGGRGNDEIHGGGDDDTIFGGSGGDDLFGDAGKDVIEGGDDNDIIDGGIGNDNLGGGRNNDTIFGDLGADDLFGNTGDDQLAGEGGFDEMHGGDGNDTLIIFEESDLVDGETYDGGAHFATGSPLSTGDLLDIRTAELVDLTNVTLTGIERLISLGEVHAKAQQIDGMLYLSTGPLTFTTSGLVHLENGSVARLVGTRTFFLNDAGNGLYLTGNLGAYTVHGGAAHDEIFGGEGNDSLGGGGGPDRLNGNGGDDHLTGGQGDDHLFGVAGKDTAHFSDISDNYTVRKDPDFSDTYIISHLDGTGSDGTDTISGIENLQFADGTLDDMPWAATGGKPISPSNLHLWGNSLLKNDLTGSSLSQDTPQRLAFAATAALSVSNISYAGSYSAGQRLSEGYDFGSGGGAPLSIGKCMLLTTGDGTPPLTNTNSLYSEELGLPGDADLDAAAAAAGRGPSFDASVITLNFTITDPATRTVSFDLIMGSEELNTSSDFGDLAAVIVNGINYALFDEDPTRVLCLNQDFDPLINNPPGTLPIEYNGVTPLLNVVAPVHLGLNTLKIAIGDLGDEFYDSGLFIGNMQESSSGGSGMYVRVNGSNGDDNLTGSALPEFFALKDGNDTVHGGDGNDLLRGESGADTLNGENGNDALDGGGGDDQMAGGLGDDAYFVERATDVVSELFDQGDDTVFSRVSETLDANVENLVLLGVNSTNGAGNGRANSITGNDGANRLSGLDGRDDLNGGAGSDRLIGGLDRDTMNGGAGSDVYDFNAIAESGLTSATRDFIKTFAQGSDIIDVLTIDAMAGTVGNNDFTLILDGGAFTAEGQIRFENAGANTLVELNVTGTSGADMAILVNGHIAFTVDDFAGLA